MQNKSINQSARYMGIVLAVISLLSILAMLHHPSVYSHGIEAQIAEIRQESAIYSFIHGILIAFILIISTCLTNYAQLRDTGKALILAGTVSFCIGTLAMVVAALMSAFVSPALAEIYSQSTPAQLDVYSGLRYLSWLTNQYFATFGAVLWGVAMCSWAFDMLARDLLTKVFGVLSLLAGLVIVISLLADWLVLSVSGMTLVLVVVCTWQLGIAWLLYSQK